MIDHTLTTHREQPSPFGGCSIRYHCIPCNLDFESAAPEPLCPNLQDYRHGQRDGAVAKRKRVTARREPWMSRAYCQGYRQARGIGPQPPHPGAQVDPEGHRESVMAESVRTVAIEQGVSEDDDDG